MPDFHPYDPYIPTGAEKLIIGSIPPHRFCVGRILDGDVDFYYGSRDNHFWQVISRISGAEFDFRNLKSAVEQRKKFLEGISAGITDIIESCGRINDRASDTSLTGMKFKDIAGLLESNQSIRMLFYTSDFVRKCVEKALGTRHMPGADSRMKKLVLNDRGYDAVILYSPSPQALRGMGPGGYDKRLMQYRNVLIDN